jgi:hypothetical protein
MKRLWIGIVVAMCWIAVCLPGIAQREAFEGTKFDWKTGKTLQGQIDIENKRYGAVKSALWAQQEQIKKEFNQQCNDCQKSSDRDGCYKKANEDKKQREKLLNEIFKAAAKEHLDILAEINLAWALKQNEKSIKTGVRKDGFRIELPGYRGNIPRPTPVPPLTPLEQREAQEDAEHTGIVKRLNAAWLAEQDRHGRIVAQLKQISDNADLLRLEQQRHEAEVQTMRKQKAAEEVRYTALTSLRNPGFIDDTVPDFDF